MTERFAYLAFLTVVGIGLVVMTVCLVAVWVLLIKQHREADRKN